MDPRLREDYKQKGGMEDGKRGVIGEFGLILCGGFGTIRGCVGLFFDLCGFF